MLTDSCTCQQILIVISIIVLIISINRNECKKIIDKFVPSYCTPEYINAQKLIPKNSAGGFDDDCKEQFTNTLKDVYGFNEITHRMRDTTSENTLSLPKLFSWGKNKPKLPSSDTLNQLLYTDKQTFQLKNNENKIENPEFKQYWNEFGPKSNEVSENFCANPINVRGDSKKCKISIENLENQHVKTYEHYTNRLKESVNFNTYKPLANHAGITDTDLVPRNYGLLHHNYLDRFKYAAPLSDIDPQYDMPYDFKKESFTNRNKNNYNDFLKEYYVDGKVKNNHNEFIKHLKEKNFNGNMAKQHSVMSSGTDICKSPLARDCFSTFGLCGDSSYNDSIATGSAYINHKQQCQERCDSVKHCVDTHGWLGSGTDKKKDNNVSELDLNNVQNEYTDALLANNKNPSS